MEKIFEHIKEFLIKYKKHSKKIVSIYNSKQLKRIEIINKNSDIDKIRCIIDKNFTLIEKCLEMIWENEADPLKVNLIDFKKLFNKIIENIWKLSNINIYSIISSKNDCQLENSREIYLTHFFDKISNIFMEEWSTNLFYKDLMKNKFFKSFNKNRHEALSIIEVKDFFFKKEYFNISNLRVINFEEKEICFEFDYIFVGELSLFLDFNYMINTSFLRRDIYVNLELLLKEMVSSMRMVYRPRDIGKSSLSLLGIPQVKYEIKPKINNIDFDINLYLFNIGDIIVKNAFDGFIYPEFVSIGIPLTKKRKVFKPGRD